MNLAHPAWLLVWIAVPILAIGAIILGRFTKRPWEKFAAERLRGRLIKREHPLPRWLSLSLLLAAITALIFTMARPQGDAGVKTEKTIGRNVMIALDLSRSMRVQDVKPDRLSQAKIVIYELLDSLKADRIGLVGFAGTPFLFAPLTIDHAAVRETVEQIDEEWVAVGGSDLASAIDLATRTLQETGQKNNALIIISDGEEHQGELDKIVQDADRAGVTIFAIGVGTEDGGFVPHPDFPNGLVDREGKKVLSRLQPDVMRKLAKETGGSYVIAGRGTDIPAMVEAAIQGMDSFEMEGGQTRVVIEFYQWILLPAILFLMASIVAGTRWRKMAGVAAAGLCLIAIPEAKADQVKDASKSFSEKRYNEARDQYRSLAQEHDGSDKAARYRLGEGVAAYEAQDFRDARSAFSDAMLSDEDKVVGQAHKGMGDTLFQLGWMGLSGSRYGDQAEMPDMEKFDELVRAQIKRMSEVELPEKGESNEFIRLEAIIMNWTDAARHYQSAAAKNPDDDAALRNRELTVNYLKRLDEILKEEKDKAEQDMPQPGEGQPQPGQGEPQEGDPQDGDGKGDKKPGEDGKDGDEKKDEGSGDKPEENKGKGKNGDKKEDDKEAKGGVNPNESPEDHARRILEENSDLEKGPLNPGQRQFRNPEKDW